jgi:hypothetical protein
MILGAIAEKHGNILSYVYADGDDPGCRRRAMKISGVFHAGIEGISLPGIELEDIRE